MPILPAGTLAKVELAGLAVGVAVLLRRGVPKAYGLSVMILAFYAVDVVGGLLGLPSGAEELAFSLDAFRAGAWWTPVTALFVHAGFAHLFGNLIILVSAGPALEDRIGERKFLVIYLLAGLAGFAAHAILAVTTRLVTPATLAVGASGAIFGVLSALAIRHPRAQLPLLLPLPFMPLMMVPAFALLLLYLAFNVVYALTDYIGGGTGIAWWGHFAGFLVGMAFAYTLPKGDPRFGGPARRPPVDAEKLAPYATTPDTRRIVEQVRALTTGAPTPDDVAYADAWIDRFFGKATCPNGHAFSREGTTATCAGGETSIDFGRSK